MPAVLDPKAEKHASAVDEQISQAASRIRFHDVAFGGLVLVAMLLVYATAMIVVDKYVVLPDWVRQLSLVGFFAASAAAGWLTIGRAFTRRVNPLYAAVQVEKTIEDAKNSVVGYVEASENGQVHPAVKAAMGARAAKTVTDADPSRTVDTKSLTYVGAIAVAFLLALVALFFVFRPAQFQSLAARTFAPFASNEIASRTQLQLVEPAGGDVTITTGQSITVKVNVTGQVPSADSAERLRVLVRHNPATPDYEEVPMEKGEHSREWYVRVPDHLVRNGFWYKVAGGDAETAEHRVTVRTLPLFSDFTVTYDFPAYTRLKPEASTGAHLRAIRGTKVTIVGKTNRTVKDGRLAFEPVTREPLAGRLLVDKPDAIQFSFLLTTSGHYRMTFSSTEGQRSPEPPPFKITVDEDLAPRVEILKPEEPEIQLPANGQLAVDGVATDDWGLESMTLRLRLAGAAPRDLASFKLQDGKSFRRTEKDGSVSSPTSLDYKGSVDFAKLADAAGAPVKLEAGMVIEYWLEATDNRTKPGASGPEADPNVGKSEVRRVTLVPPVMDMQERNRQDAQKEQRKNEEQANNANQQKRLDTEKRDPPQPNGMPPMPMTDPMTPPMNEPKPPMPMNMGGAMDPMMPKEPMKNPGGMDPAMPPMKNMNDPAMPMMPPMNMGNNGMPETAPPPASPQDRDDRKTAEKIQEQIDKQKGGGDGKPGPTPEQDRANPAEQKPMPMMGETPPPDSNTKEPPKDPMNMGGGGAESKPMGTPPKNEEPGSTKPEPSPMNMNMMGGSQSAENKPVPKNMDPMMGGTGAEKPEPKSGDPMPMNGEGAKPSGEPMGMQKGGNEGPGKTKPMPQPGPGSEKPDTKPADPKGQPNDGGDAKPQAAPKPSDAKPGPMDMMNLMGGGTSETKPMPSDMKRPGGEAETKPDMGQPGAGQKGADKPSPDQKPGAGQKPTPEQQKEFEQNLKDLASKDPAKQQAAREKLDKQIGEKNRQDIEKEMKDFEKNVQDLNSNDDKTRADAQKKLDKQVGEKNRKDIEDIQNGMNSTDPKERAAAEEKLKDLQQKAGANQAEKKDDGMAKGSEPKKESGSGQKVDPKEVEKALDDVAGNDPMKKDAAKKKLDDMLGKGAGDKAEKAAEKMKSEDFGKQAEARKERDELLDQAEKMAKKDNPAGKPKGKELSKEETERLAEKLKDLNSPDEVKRKQAEKALDDKIGEQARKELQEAMKDPKKAEELKKKLDELAKKGGSNVDDDGKFNPKNGAGGDPTIPVREAMKEDAHNRARTAQLQLENFEKNKDNKGIQRELNMTPEEYQAFLDRFRKHAEQLKKEADDLENADPSKPVPPTRNVSGGTRVESKGGVGGAGAAGGPSVAAPGYADALREFNKGASKAPPKK